MPWRGINDPYATWVSETMLQQTQVTTVIPYYLRFMDCFKTVTELANANLDKVLKHWEGLGYYSRARNLQKGAQQVIERHNGIIPKDEKALLALSGIGPYTAGAILSIAFNLPHAAVDGNVIRVLTRLYGIREDVSDKHTLESIHLRANELVQHPRPGDFNQALMDLGATVCTHGTASCDLCPLTSFCDAFQYGDQDELPIKTQTRAPKQVPVGVGIITCKDRILVTKRTERMLNGLYVFLLDEGNNNIDDMLTFFPTKGLNCQYKAYLGDAKHVFTHRVWQMKMYHFSTNTPQEIKNSRWVTKDEMLSLAFPTAMKIPLQRALEVLK